MSQYLQAVGVLRTHPNDRDDQSLAELTGLGKDNKGWLVIHLEKDVCDYYMRQFNWANRAQGLELMRPAWGAHISVIRGEVITDLNLWKQIDGKEINFSYVPVSKTTETRHCFMPVLCQEALDLREFFGLPREPRLPLHMTFGILKGKENY